MDEEFDFIIIGAGSAGCVLAARLTEDPANRVLLLEAGGSRFDWTVDMPAAIATLLKNPRRNWQYRSQPEPGIGGRTIDHPRGKLLGGSSSINGMVYSRGHALDYNNWAFNHGCTGWSYAEILPYFRRSETYELGSDPYRGGDGPLSVTVPRLADNPLNIAFIDAGLQAGYPTTGDPNGFQQEGFGNNQCTISNGVRQSTARAFLLPAMSRTNLIVRADSLVERILTSNKRATGVSYKTGGRTRIAKAGREVILASGAFGSPQILMLSGIGPARHLLSKGIQVVHDAPGVGQNLQDHPDLVLQQWCSRPVSLYDASRGLGKIKTGLDWFLRKSGPGASNQFHASAFIRTRAGIEHPDLKLELLPIAMDENMSPLKGHSFQVHMTMMRAHSRGSVELASANPADKPIIRFNYLDDPRDILTLREAVRLTREVLAQPAMAQFSGEEIEPGPSVQSDEQIDDWIRKSVATAFHPSCSCRMGGEKDSEAVVNPDLKVRGVSALRVVDASIMPHVTSSNTNAPTIMIAEKAADMILGRSPPAPLDVPFFTDPNWRTEQR